MKVTFCGTGEAFTLGGASSGIIVQHGDTQIMLDCGPGSVQVAINSGVKLDEVQAIFITHLHADHVFDIAELLTSLTFWSDTLPDIYGPSGIVEYMDDTMALVRKSVPNLSPFQNSVDRFKVRVTAHEVPIVVGDLTIRSESVPHTRHVHAQAYRISTGDSAIVYSGDTQPAPDIIVPLAKDADMLIHEAYTAEGLQAQAQNVVTIGRKEFILGAYPASHSLVADVARLASEAKVGTLVLTHLFQTEKEGALITAASEWFDGKVVVARDGLVVLV